MSSPCVLQIHVTMEAPVLRTLAAVLFVFVHSENMVFFVKKVKQNYLLKQINLAVSNPKYLIHY